MPLDDTVNVCWLATKALVCSHSRVLMMNPIQQLGIVSPEFPSEDEQAVIRELLEGMIVKYEARRWTGTGTGAG